MTWLPTSTPSLWSMVRAERANCCPQPTCANRNSIWRTHLTVRLC